MAIIIKLTVSKNFKGRHKVSVTDERQSHEHVSGDDDVKEDETGSSLVLGEPIAWELLHGTGCTVGQRKQ